MNTIETPNLEIKTHTGIIHPNEDPSASGSINMSGRAVMRENNQQTKNAFLVPSIL